MHGQHAAYEIRARLLKAEAHMAVKTSGYASILPYLRRYARLLTGNQKAGDAMVLATLNAIALDPKLTTLHADPRHILYRVLMRLWNSPIGDYLDTLPISENQKCQHANAELRNSLLRPAFLLVTIEGFSHAEARDVLEVSESEFASFLAEAHKLVSEQLATEVLIIEDELLIAFLLSDFVEQLGHRVASIARTKKQAVKLARLHQPKLILADIHLADGSSGIDAVDEITEFKPITTIFVTAYPERLLTGLRTEPTFLVTKPFKVEQVAAVISQALFFEAKATSGVDDVQIIEAVLTGNNAYAN